jgi:hypothetical protein
MNARCTSEHATDRGMLGPEILRSILKARQR